MESVSLFSLERHEGPYEKWPLRTRLFVNGEPSRTTLPGYTLLHQFLTEYGYLLVTDCDCLFEETTNIVLLDQASLRVISYKQFFVPYGSFNLDRFEWIDSRRAKITFYKDDHWLLTLRSKGIPFLSPRIRVQRIHSPVEAVDA
jgi:hypothetical protein